MNTPLGTPSDTPLGTPSDTPSDTPADRFLMLQEQIEAATEAGQTCSVSLSIITPLGEQPVSRMPGTEFLGMSLKPGKYSARVRFQGGKFGSKVTFTVPESPFVPAISRVDAPARDPVPSRGYDALTAIMDRIERLERSLSGPAHAPTSSAGLTLRDVLDVAERISKRDTSDPLQVLTLAEKLASKFAPPAEDPNAKVVGGTLQAIGEMVKLGREEKRAAQAQSLPQHKADAPAPATNATTLPDIPDLGNPDWNKQAKELQGTIFLARNFKATLAAKTVEGLIDEWENQYVEPPILTWYGIAHADTEELLSLIRAAIPETISVEWLRSVLNTLKTCSLDRVQNEATEESTG